MYTREDSVYSVLDTIIPSVALPSSVSSSGIQLFLILYSQYRISSKIKKKSSLQTLHHRINNTPSIIHIAKPQIYHRPAAARTRNAFFLSSLTLCSGAPRALIRGNRNREQSHCCCFCCCCSLIAYLVYYNMRYEKNRLNDDSLVLFRAECV